MDLLVNTKQTVEKCFNGVRIVSLMFLLQKKEKATTYQFISSKGPLSNGKPVNSLATTEKKKVHDSYRSKNTYLYMPIHQKDRDICCLNGKVRYIISSVFHSA